LKAERQESGAVAVGEEAEVADAHESRRQQVEQEAAQKLFDSQGHEPFLVAMDGVAPTESNVFLGESNQPGVRDGDAMGVGAEIAQHVFWAAEGSLGVDDPVVAEQHSQPGSESVRLGQRQQAAVELEFTSKEGVAQSGDELAAEDAAVPAEASQAGAPATEPARYRQDDGLVPRVISRKLDEHLTATIKERARHEGTTVQGALCAALVLAGRKTSSTWRKQSVRVMSPVNARAHLGAGEACGLYLGGGGMITFQPADSRAFWELARFAKKEIAPSQTLQSLSTSLHA